MSFYKQGAYFALQQLKLGFASPAAPKVPVLGQKNPTPSPFNAMTTHPAQAQLPTQPAPGSGPFPTTQTGKGSIPSSPSLQAGVTGNNSPAASTGALSANTAGAAGAGSRA